MATEFFIHPYKFLIIFDQLLICVANYKDTLKLSLRLNQNSCALKV